MGVVTGHRAGVPVRDELERLLALRRRRVRRPAGAGGAARVLPRVHLHRAVDLRLGPAAEEASTWPASGWSRSARMLSAYFILAANSWMQNPVGFRYNAERGRAELTDIGAVLTNKVVLVTFPHTIFAAFMVGGAFVAGVAIWHLVRRPGVDTGAFRTALRLGAVDRHRRRRRGRVQRRPAGQGDDRGAADEDGGGRGAVRDGAAGVVLDLHHRHARRLARGLLGQGAVPAVLPGHRALRRRGEGHQRAAGSPTRSSTGRAPTSRTSRSPTGPSG